MNYSVKYGLEFISKVQNRFVNEKINRKELAIEYGLPQSTVNYWCRGFEKNFIKEMPNKFEVRGDIAVVFVNCKGSIYECLIDTEDLEKVKSFQYAWIGVDMNGKIYVSGVIQKNRKLVKRFMVHRLIMEPPKDMVVDHINGDPLDNRKSNLRVVTNAQNAQNRKLNRDSSTGVRCVSWHKTRKYYAVRTRVNGKTKEIARCKTIEEATKIAFEARRINSPYSEN